MNSVKDVQLIKEYVEACPNDCKELLGKLETVRYELECVYEREYEFYEEYDIPDDLELEDLVEDCEEYDFDEEELSDLVEELEYWENEHESLSNELKERAIRWKESQKTGKE